MDTCPKCHHKLLVHSSSRCNWCGELIEDAAYQEEATKKREEFFTADRVEQASEIAAMDSVCTNPELHTVTTFIPREVFPEHHAEAPHDSGPQPQSDPPETIPTT